MNYQSLLTTTDNPFDPFEQFTQWQLFDAQKGRDTCGYLMRIAKISDDMSEVEYDKEINRAIDEIIAENPLGIYKKVTKELVLD